MRNSRSDRLWIALAALLLTGLLVTPLSAQVEPEKRNDVAEKAFRHAALDIPALYRELPQLPAQVSAEARSRLAALGANNALARVDQRSGRFVTLAPATPLVPGDGVGNHLTWSQLGLPPGTAFGAEGAAAREAATRAAFVGYLHDNSDLFGIDVAELGEARITSHGDGEVYQLYLPREIDGIPVRDSHVSAVISHGNINLVGVHSWGDLDGGRGGGGRVRAAAAGLEEDQARLAAESYLSPLQVTREWGKPELVYLPMARGKNASQIPLGRGYAYRLAWSFKVEVARDGGSWEVLVDAKNGAILANDDRNHYATATGGVQPVTNDGVVPDGVEQAGWPMPFMEVGSQITDTGGNYSLSGSQTARFYGPYVNMADNCGTDSLTQSGGIDWGTSGGTDCTTPGFGGAGNTHASRDGFYELNKLKEMARGQLPSNSWLQGRITANMNINQNCNAFWNGSTVNFYRSGGGCANTGEIAGVFDHEWGHGMDDNDANPSIASPSGEGIADMYTALRLNDSCIGRNFQGSVCSGNGDPCLTCTGVRDIDYEKRQSGQPHDYSWANSNCGGSVHCLGGVYSEAMWSLWKRKLQSAPFNYDNNTAHEIVTRLTYIGGGAVGTWFSGGAPFGGCSSSGGYLNFLAADDDNGNLNDGTPHMTAIYAAFNDQEIACNTPTVQNSGCSGTPSVAPTVNGSSGNQSASLSWSPVSGTTEYEVFRTEGVFGCDFGKVRLGATGGTSWNDSGLMNGREYSYVVIPKGSDDACFGPASACTSVTPASAPDFTVACSPSSQSIQQNGSGNATCTVSSLGGFSGSVALSCAGNPGGIGCAFAPSSVSVPSGGSANSTLTMSVSGGQSTGTFNFNAVGSNGGDNRTSALTVTVTPEGQNGPQDASYDSGLGAPRCSLPGTECDSLGLLDGRANLGPEPNQPNTVDTCTDGASGSYHSDESIDRIVVSSLSGFDFNEGDTVEVAVTVWAWNTGSADTLDLYYAADANNPSWQLIGSQTAPGGSAQTMTAQYTLPAGSLQAVRANFRYQGSASPCSSGNYDDHDDLVFAVNSGGPSNTAPSVSITSPANGSTFDQGDNVGFTGTATDAEDGSLSGSLAWTSSLDGPIGSGASFSTSGLSLGTHTITASVTDSGGLPDSDSISLTIQVPPNTAPVVDISTPSNGSSYVEGSPVAFSGTATDAEDGNLSASLSWSSSLDGVIGSGGSFSTSGLSVGNHSITASVTDSGGLPGSDSISLEITPSGGQNGPQDAVYNSGLGAPACTIAGSECDSLGLLDGRANLGPEPNQPNTVDTCTDGTSGSYHDDESIDSIIVRTLSGDDFTAGATVEVEVTVWAWNTGSADTLDLYYTSDANNPSWQLIGSQTPPGGGAQTLAAQYTLPTGGLQAVRANFRYNGSQSPCTSGSYNDHDDLVFAVGGGGPAPSCSVDEDFEGGSAGWTTSGGCATGTFVLGTPTAVVNGGVTTQLAGDHTSGSGNALFTAVNTAAGTDDVDGGTCTVTSPAYSVSAASDLSVWTFHGQRDAGGDAADGFLLEYSTNGGSTWSTLQQYGDVTVNASWTEATTTVAGGSNVRVRVSATDGTASGDLVEAGLDDLSICDQ